MPEKKKCEQKMCYRFKDCPFKHDRKKCLTAPDVVGDTDPFERWR